MKTRLRIVTLGMAALVLAAGCSKPREITERDRREAALVASEAQSAILLREWARAEGLLAKAVKLVPQADYWLSLGSTRVRLSDRAGAKKAYEEALRIFEADAKKDPAHAEPLLNQVRVLALLGRLDDSRAVLAKAGKQFPNDPTVKAMLDPKQFQQMISAPGFKENAL